MTFFKKYMLLLVGGGIAAVLILAAAVFMVKFSREYARVQSELTSNQTRLDRLHQRVPFPSVENVERVKGNLRELEGYLEGVLDSLSLKQPEAEAMERAAFPSEIERFNRRLRSLASDEGVRLPEAIAFGFERYAAGNLPSQDHVQRLVVQLRSVELLSSMLFRSGISELVSVEREVFDQERTAAQIDPAPAMRRGFGATEVVTPAAPTGPEGVEGLYSRERYTFTFFADDAALRMALNQIAESPVLMIVRSLELRNELGLGGSTAAQRISQRLQPRDVPRDAPRDMQRMMAGEGGRPGMGATAPQAGQQTVVAGRERVRVTLVVDVYRFERTRDEENT